MTTVEGSMLRTSGARVQRISAVVLVPLLAGLSAAPVTAAAVEPGMPPPPPVEAPPVEAPPGETPALEQAPSEPPPVAAEVEAYSPPAAGPVDGQWVYTRQYGWVWMPYDREYTYVPDDGDPVMYVYGESLGWRWVVAPWIYGWGPAPHWGPRGRAYFTWYARPWFAAPRIIVRRDYYDRGRYYDRGWSPRRHHHHHVHVAPRGHRRDYGRREVHIHREPARREVHIHRAPVRRDVHIHRAPRDYGRRESQIHRAPRDDGRRESRIHRAPRDNGRRESRYDRGGDRGRREAHVHRAPRDRGGDRGRDRGDRR